MWMRNQNLHSASNPAHMGSCSPDEVIYGNERQFKLGSASAAPHLQMMNGSCLWVDDPDTPSASAITVGDCNQA